MNTEYGQVQCRNRYLAVNTEYGQVHCQKQVPDHEHRIRSGTLSETGTVNAEYGQVHCQKQVPDREHSRYTVRTWLTVNILGH